jgi:hemerythrin-like domain-containing protein
LLLRAALLHTRGLSVIQINASPQHGFDEPLGLLSDCHRRVERFLDAMIRAVETSRDGVPAPGISAGLEAALRYFREAAPRHTADEEDSLFPRMLAAGGPRAAAAAEVIARLNAQHEAAEALHGAVDALSHRWLAEGRLPASDLARLRARLLQLRTIYEEHIAVEDHNLFPLAASMLDADALVGVGREMALRRGLDPALAEPARP